MPLPVILHNLLYSSICNCKATDC